MININLQAPVQRTRKITIAASPEKVWVTLTQIHRWVTWQTDITNVTIDGPVREGTIFSWRTGGVQIQSTLHTVVPFKEFGWTGKTFGIFAIHNWTLTQDANQVIVTVEESMEGLLAWLFKKSFTNNLEKGMKNWLELLKTTCEKPEVR